MVREIKFKAYDKISYSIYEVESINFTTKIVELLSDTEGIIYTFERKFDEVDLLEFTGFQDKNDVDIYEGNIISADPFKEYQDVSVNEAPLKMPIFDKDNQIIITVKLNISNDEGYIDIFGGEYIDMDTIEIIGNIYDNPELLIKV